MSRLMNLFNRKSTRIVSYCLCLAILLCLLPQGIFVLDGKAHDSGSVIDSELAEIMQDSSETELIPVSVWIEETDTELIEEQILKDIGINKEKIDELDPVGDPTADRLVDEYIAAERSIYSNLQSSINHEYWDSLVNSKAIDPALERKLYICSYSPTIITQLTKQEIAELANNRSTQEIMYYENAFEVPAEDLARGEVIDLIDTTEIALANIRVPEAHALGYTGTGIKIGQVESRVPNTSYFGSASITVQSGIVSSLHATRVMEMMLNVAPDAQYYCASAVDGLEYAIEWVLSQGVNVINMSAGFTNPDVIGKYDSRSKWVDHLAINHSVHFVKSAGNDAIYISSPGMAYNIITVGAANNALSARANFSCFVENGTLDSTHYADKPDILAPGEGLYFEIEDDAGEHYDSGTSYAAPIVTGIAALMMQSRTSLKTRQASLKACMLASIKNTTLRYVPSDTLYHECGAGLVDAYSSVITALYGHFTTGQYFSAGASTSTTKTYTFTTSSSDTIKRVALNWLQYNTVTGSTHVGVTPSVGSYVNMNLKVLDPSNNVVETSDVTYGNVEIVQFTPQPSTTYTVVVSITNSPSQTAHFSVAWW